jgi:hypothetical protein
VFGVDVDDPRRGDAKPLRRFHAGREYLCDGQRLDLRGLFQGRVIVIGCCATLEAAMRAAMNV